MGTEAKKPESVPESSDIEKALPKPVLQVDAKHKAETPEPATEPVKMKDLFKLMQKQDFEMLSKFSAMSPPDGSAAVTKTMVKHIGKCLVRGFGMEEKKAVSALQVFIAAKYKVVDDIHLQPHKPTQDDPLPEDSETREGPQLKKGKRVSVVEEWVFDGSVDGKQAKIAYVSRPERGWLALSELDPLPEVKCADQEDKMMEKISLFLRLVEKYDIVKLEQQSDELGMEIDFLKLARTRIVDAILKNSQNYQRKSVEMSCKKLGTDDLKQCLMALER